MKLRQPTDFLILEALHTYGRNVAPNLAAITDKSRKNINNRLPVLNDYSLVRKIGPAERSGLYELTDKGRVALRLRDEYDHSVDFDGLVTKRLEASEGAAPSEAPARGGSTEEATSTSAVSTNEQE